MNRYEIHTMGGEKISVVAESFDIDKRGVLVFKGIAPAPYPREYFILAHGVAYIEIAPHTEAASGGGDPPKLKYGRTR